MAQQQRAIVTTDRDGNLNRDSKLVLPDGRKEKLANTRDAVGGTRFWAGVNTQLDRHGLQVKVHGPETAPVRNIGYSFLVEPKR